MFNRNKTGELVVKPRVSPRVKLVIAAVAGALLLLTAGWIYNYGSSMAGFDRLSATRYRGQLQSEIEKVKAQNQELREALARAQRSLQMNQTAYQELDNSLKASAQEIVKLREELNFYRNIISPADKKGGLRIQSLSVEPGDSENQYRYKLVLVQALKYDRPIRGSARIQISGMQAGRNTVLNFPTKAQKRIRVNFKYFQDIQGKLELPQNFEPRQITVRVITAGGRKTVEETYAWPKV